MARGLILNRSRQVPAEETPAFGSVAERFRRAGDLDRAIALCRDGLKRFPKQLSARVTLGWSLLDKGLYAEARAEFETVRRKAPDNLAAIRGLAELHDREENAIASGAHAEWQQREETAEADKAPQASAFEVALSRHEASLAAEPGIQETALPSEVVIEHSRVAFADDPVESVVATVETVERVEKVERVEEPFAPAAAVAEPSPVAHQEVAYEPVLEEFFAAPPAEEPPSMAAASQITEAAIGVPAPVAEAQPAAPVVMFDAAPAVEDFAENVVTLPEAEVSALGDLAGAFEEAAEPTVVIEPAATFEAAAEDSTVELMLADIQASLAAGSAASLEVETPIVARAEIDFSDASPEEAPVPAQIVAERRDLTSLSDSDVEVAPPAPAEPVVPPAPVVEVASPAPVLEVTAPAARTEVAAPAAAMQAPALMSEPLLELGELPVLSPNATTKPAEAVSFLELAPLELAAEPEPVRARKSEPAPEVIPLDAVQTSVSPVVRMTARAEALQARRATLERWLRNVEARRVQLASGSVA